MLALLKQLFRFVRHQQKAWLGPLLFLLVLLGGILVVAEGSAIAPFIYAIF